jgi:hypothetical protein
MFQAKAEICSRVCIPLSSGQSITGRREMDILSDIFSKLQMPSEPAQPQWILKCAGATVKVAGEMRPPSDADPELEANTILNFGGGMRLIGSKFEISRRSI